MPAGDDFRSMNNDPAQAAEPEQRAAPATSCKSRLLRCSCLVFAGLGAWFGSSALLKAQRSGFDLARATTFARLAGAAYCDPAALEAWECGEKCIKGVEKPVKVCQGYSTHAFVAKWDGQALVSFQGTHTLTSMVQDLRFYKDTTRIPQCDNCYVHTGFFEEWLSLAACVQTSLEDLRSPTGSSVRVTGHSLGGAIAVIAMTALKHQGWHISEAYTFGEPRTANTGFSLAFSKTFADTSFFRVTYHMDPVPHLPPQNFGFFHVAPEVFFPSSNNFTSYVTCAEPESDNCSGINYDVAADLLYINDHLVYMGVDTATTGCQNPSAASERSDTRSEQGTRGNASAEVVV